MLNPAHIDSRITLHVTSLLTAVFLQNSYLASLPEIGYLVLLDKIYIIAYFLIFISILEAIITAEWVKDQKPRNYRRVIRIDRLLLIFQATIFPLSVIGLIIFAYLW